MRGVGLFTTATLTLDLLVVVVSVFNSPSDYTVVLRKLSPSNFLVPTMYMGRVSSRAHFTLGSCSWMSSVNICSGMSYCKMNIVSVKEVLEKFDTNLSNICQTYLHAILLTRLPFLVKSTRRGPLRYLRNMTQIVQQNEKQFQTFVCVSFCFGGRKRILYYDIWYCSSTRSYESIW